MFLPASLIFGLLLPVSVFCVGYRLAKVCKLMLAYRVLVCSSRGENFLVWERIGIIHILSSTNLIGCWDRARDKHARLAYNAFMLGDHSLAKKFSREARELWREAEKLHAQAAAEILIARNPGVYLHGTCTGPLNLLKVYRRVLSSQSCQPLVEVLLIDAILEGFAGEYKFFPY